MSETNRNRSGSRSGGSRGSSGSRGSGRAAAAKRSAERVAAVQNARNLGSGKSGSGRSSNGRRRKYRRQGPDYAKILMILIAIVIALLCVAVGMKGCSRDVDSTDVEQTTAESETEIHAEITVNGISVNGLTKSEARDQVIASMGWDMKVTYEDNTMPIDNLLLANVDQVLEEAYAQNKAGNFEIPTSGVEEQAAAAAAAVADAWDVQPKNGSIDSFDEASGEFKFAGGQNGLAIDREALAAEIVKAVQSGDYKKTIPAAANVVAPEISEEEARASFKRIGTYTTTTTSNKARNENIRIASKALHGKIIQPGETFSFNLTTGNRTTDKGYQPAGAYVNGVLVEEPGGGVCQVSSTLYNAVVFSGLKTTERHAHSYEPSYVTPGEDAMVSYDGHQGPDMKFINNSKTAVGIKTSFSNQKLTVSVYGSPILEEGVTLSMESKKTAELAPPPPVYEEDQTLQPGVEVEAKAPTMGSKWVTNLVTKKDGVVVEEIVLHNSTYNGKSATIKRNTSGVVITPSDAETTPADGSGAAENTDPNAGPGSETMAPTAPESSTFDPEETEAPKGPASSHTNQVDEGHTGGPGSIPNGPGSENVSAGSGPAGLGLIEERN